MIQDIHQRRAIPVAARATLIEAPGFYFQASWFLGTRRLEQVS